MEPIAWLIPKCPNFYFLPSLWYDQIFTRRGTVDEKMSLAYWESVGFPSIPLTPCEEEKATLWVVNNAYAAIDAESANAARFLGKSVVPVCPA